MHTPIKFYIKIPTTLYRAGAATRPRFDYIRTNPPRNDDQIFDIKIDPNTKMIDHESGGMSLFDKPRFNNSKDWWVLPEGTKLPPGFTVTKDLTDGVFKGHYSIRALSTMHIDTWKKTLKEWAESQAIHINDYRNKDAK